MEIPVGGGYPPPTGDLAKPPRHPLLEKKTFEQLLRNDVIETRPHILHFGGFQIHKEHTHVLKVVNISTSSLRVSIIGPTTPWFKMSFDKKGLLAPGMSEDITVTFEPHEWRYYYDTIKVFCGEQSENLIVPIHAYPSANDIVLPRIIDFGSVAIGTSRSKVIPLSCKIPIQFQYEITILEAHPDFKITPLSGVIPADGSTEVVVTFTPTKHRTCRTELQFNIAQFDFDPVTVSVVGSCAPDTTKLEILKSEEAEMAVTATQKKQDKIAAKISKLQEKQGRGPLDVTHPVHKEDELERYVNGVKVPTTRTDQQATNFVLNQTAGKLPLKDLFAFIKEQREVADNRRKWASTQGAQQEEEVAEDEDRQALELRFELQYREVDKRDKDKELKSTPACGEEPPTQEALEEVRRARKLRHEKLLQMRMQTDVARVESVLSVSKVTVPNTFKPVVKPHWDECENDSFSVRLQVIERFVKVGSKVLMRVRAQRRANLLIEALRQNNVTDRASCKAWVDAETKAAASGTAPRSAEKDSKKADESSKAASKAAEELGQVPTVHITEDFVLPAQIPTTLSGLSAEARQPVEVMPLDNFEEFLSVDINVHMDYKVLQYEQYSIPPPAAYMRPNNDRKRLHAALEEHLIRGERGDFLDGAEMPLTMPESCMQPPEHDALSLLIPSISCRTYVAFPESTEVEPEHRLSQKPSLLEPLQTEPLLPPGIMGLETPWLEAWRSSRQIVDPFQYSDPLPCSFAEAGGAMGPRLGCDMGGPRLSYMPVGGFDRDLPSDTDDDEQPELSVPPPGKDMHEKAASSLNGPVTSELWYKERSAEEALVKLCDDNGRAVRDRLKLLNQDLSYRNKLFLG
mmetsp:Transcript_4828/g.8609  ORF Transcript_4828/g.8609 Transcript_4828/m.8609 type:complete len:857 (+) Transcript_4828:103-2673(+)